MDSSPDRKELKAGWKHETEVKTLTKEDVAKHKTRQDLWITVHGNVYDVTAYAADHPGGADALVEVAGQDATSAYEDVGHSDDAGEIMQSFLVGKLEGASPGSPAASTPTPKPASVQVVRRPEAQSGGSAVPQLLLLIRTPQFGIAVLVVGGLAGLVLASKALGHGGGFVQGTREEFDRKDLGVSPGRIAHTKHVLESTSCGPKKEVSNEIWLSPSDLPSKYSVLGLPIGQHVAIRGTVDDSTVVRSYTPISNNRDLGRLDLIIRVYPQGQLGNYLKNLNIGDEAEIRGPKGAMKYRKGLCKEIGMVAGGTGITPMYQLIRAICEDPTDQTKVSLIYGNRSEGDIMMREKLDGFAKAVPEKFTVYYTLDKPGPAWKGGKGYVDAELLRKYMPKASADTKVLLCGPPGMVNATKNNLVSVLGFEPPGSVSKISDQVFCF
ncbi:hypothetical protein AMS68_004056 [Peltaster fructicola]|uniref:Cytochrome-b5 reductase n=1 Tax=Peltaster fructicola TaxID=286661 RepID=A0A6H0XV88_9PEZI|nr:hypothetical protein AMS68_004056 [Peltaster fructicola]